MSDLKAEFEKAAADVQKLTKKPDNETLLKLYALYKQATSGDVNGPRPGAFDMVGQAKYTAWTKLKGVKQDAAMQQYISLAQNLLKIK
jgi:acyl-CoA-binding protein